MNLDKRGSIEVEVILFIVIDVEMVVVLVLELKIVFVVFEDLLYKLNLMLFVFGYVVGEE